ncbi:hypothetical protein [Falsiruegeria litorea]|uniref:hypothetical protein n=1 Tax=Falsiruegeria litorea TaxID=1280831 RepID=UPI001BFDB969|nr:hypothetical protein [Falsiruegeria litorea]MBT8167504.1 hypothetical protein [Falsiruegeria litorea]
MKGHKWKKSICIVVSIFVMLTTSGCNTDESISYNDARISYINALDEQVSFYVKKDGESGNLYNDKHHTIMLMKYDHSDEIKHKWFGYQKSEFAVQDSNSKSSKAVIKKSLKDNEKYWLIAWLDSGHYKLSVVKKYPSSRDNVYRVRIFADSEYKVNVNDSFSFTTSKGEVSSYLTVDNCSSMTLEDEVIDLCGKDSGYSYIAVVSGERLVSLVKSD